MILFPSLISVFRSKAEARAEKKAAAMAIEEYDRQRKTTKNLL